jgi:uncharacterized protein YkwD
MRSALVRLMTVPGVALLTLLNVSVRPSPLVAQPATVNCDVSDPDRPIEERETEMLAAINAYRSELGLEALQISSTLVRETRWKASALAIGGPRPLTLADHDDPGRTWDQRFVDCGYPASAAFAENLGVSDAGNAEQLQAWKLSPSHDTNLRDGSWRFIGLTRFDAGNDIGFWALAFGTDPG